jgi:hypothetical protein
MHPVFAGFQGSFDSKRWAQVVGGLFAVVQLEQLALL